jgi:hypothetical protein
MPSERAARDDFLVAAEHMLELMSITDQIDELIPCGWLSKEAATRIREIPQLLFRCSLDDNPMFRMLRDSVGSLRQPCLSFPTPATSSHGTTATTSLPSWATWLG